ncbi:MAG TPA: hypothetical protein VND68_12575, partial [Chloroflexia bacterium]|nr:hypothetical protein [Chloroflexia bacterium]
MGKFATTLLFLLISTWLLPHFGFSTQVPTQLPPASALQAGRFFPETGRTVRGRFLTYWEQNGGLQQQGYPVSEEMQEISELDGKTYTVQYFERAVFERHPENQPPFDVLLTLLGVYEYRNRYGSGGAPGQRTNPDNPRHFEQTNHSVGGAFRRHWEEHGGLQQQGYPISEEFQETSPLDGKMYTVQYFERAAFERHPENPPPYDVLLSHLGTFRYRAKHGAAGAGNGVGTDLATRLVSRTLIAGPIAAGGYIFWLDSRGGGNSVYGYDLVRGTEFLVSGSSDRKHSLASDGQTLVWVIQNTIVRGYNLTTEQEHTVLDIGSGFLGGLALDDGLLYYEGGSQEKPGLYARNLENGQEQLISPRGGAARAKAGRVLWAEERQECTSAEGAGRGPNCISRWRLRTLDAARTLKGRELPLQESIEPQIKNVTDEGNIFSGYDLSGDTLAYARYGDVVHLVMDISSTEGAPKPVIKLGSRAAIAPLLSGDTLVWTEAPTGTGAGPKGWSLHAFSVASGATRAIIPEHLTRTRA